MDIWLWIASKTVDPDTFISNTCDAYERTPILNCPNTIASSAFCPSRFCCCNVAVIIITTNSITGSRIEPNAREVARATCEKNHQHQS